MEETIAKEMPSSQSWLPSSSDAILGARTRPASYGRASSWSDFQSDTTRHTSPSLPPTTSTTNNHEGSASTFNTQQDNTAWYPAAGTSNVNEVDEPNQQGLAKPKNSATTPKHYLSMTIIAMVFITFC